MALEYTFDQLRRGAGWLYRVELDESQIELDEDLRSSGTCFQAQGTVLEAVTPMYLVDPRHRETLERHVAEGAAATERANSEGEAARLHMKTERAASQASKRGRRQGRRLS